MAKGLKCPRCRGYNAYKVYKTGQSRQGWQEFKQKLCPCGYEGRRTYYDMAFPTREELLEKRRQEWGY